jgi:RecB family exonuclease
MKLELSPTSLREKEQALLFRQALECAEERLSLVRMTEDSTGREVSWSPFIGPLVEKTDRMKKLLGSGMTVTLAADPVGIFFGGSPGGHRDIRGVYSGRLPMHRPFFAEALAAERSRLDFGAPFGACDGIIGSRPGLADGPFSPSRLQRWVRCPFLYLAERVWRLAEPCGSAVTVSPPAEVMGSILHSALARCLSVPGKRVGEALEEAAAENDLAGILGSPALAGVFTSARLGEVEELLRFIEASGLSPDGEDALEAGRSAPIGPAGVVLGGRIDMILRRGDERVVLDLKTGANRSRRRVAEEIEKGDLLQIPLYAAILAANGTPADGAGLLFSSRPSLDVIFEGAELEGFIEASLEKTAGIVEKIGNGVFPPARAASGSGACTGCWASHLCRRSPVERIPGKLAATSALVDFESTWLAGEGSNAAGNQ